MTKVKYENSIPSINRNSEALTITGVSIVDVLEKTVHENSTIICRAER